MRFVIAFGASLVLAGCNVDEGAAKKVAALEEAVAQQGKLIQDLKKANEALKLEVAGVKFENSINSYSISLQSLENKPELSLTDKSYSTVRTRLGIFLVSVANVTAYANGVKVALEVGNPQYMSYAGMKLKFTWNKAGGEESTEQSKEIEIPQTLRAGAWNKVDVVLSPAKTDDIENVRIALVPNQIQLLVSK